MLDENADADKGRNRVAESSRKSALINRIAGSDLLPSERVNNPF